MANKEESFLSKHGDKINAAGHVISTLQNAKIAERQRKIAQLQAATAVLQKEENELKKKELELLEKQQKALEEEKRRALQKQKEKEELKAELLDLAPRLNRILDEILQTAYTDTFDGGKDIYEVSSALAYLNEHKGVIEDINFHEYLYLIHEKLNKGIAKYRKEFNSFNDYLEKFNSYLENHSLYFEVILIILGAKQAEVTQLAEVKLYNKVIQDLISQNELASNLIASLQEYEKKFLSKEFEFSDRFVPSPIKRNTFNIISGFLKSVEAEELETELIEYRMEEVKANFLAKKCINYLSGSSVKTSVLKNKLDLINKNLINNENIKTLKRAVDRYVARVNKEVLKLKNLRKTLPKSKSIESDINAFRKQIMSIESRTGISSEYYLSEIDTIVTKEEKQSEMMIMISILGIFSAIIFLILIIINIDNSEKTDPYILFMVLSISPLILYGLISIFTDGQILNKLRDISSKYSSEVCEELNKISII